MGVRGVVGWKGGNLLGFLFWCHISLEHQRQPEGTVEGGRVECPSSGSATSLELASPLVNKRISKSLIPSMESPWASQGRNRGSLDFRNRLRMEAVHAS